MNRIDKNISFFKKNYWLILGFVWLFLGVGMFLTKMPLEFGWNRDLIIPGLYLLTAILYFISGYRQENTEYVEWNDELIVVKPYGKKRKEYQLSEIENLTISNNHLIIKAHNASGTMVELKDYHSEDVLRLRENFGSPEILTQ